MVRDGGWEFFELEPTEMRRTVSDFRRMFEELETPREAVAALSAQSSNNLVLNATDEDRRRSRDGFCCRKKIDVSAAIWHTYKSVSTPS